MKENFLHFVWQNRLFSHQNLETTQYQLLQIFDRGEWNHGTGPDFFNGKIKLENIEWAGNIELHVKSSDWYLHKHQQDAAYENVILHVVWEDDKPVVDSKGKLIPTLVLKGRVSLTLQEKYLQLLSTQKHLLCYKISDNISQELRQKAIKKALFDRLRTKVFDIESLLNGTQKDWQETAYQCLAKAFGFRENGEAFLQLSQSLPLKVLQKHRDSIMQMEALAFGQAGFLDTIIEDDQYMKALKKEYEFLKKKYQLVSLNKSIWKTGKIRPANFPTIRIAQFIAFLYEHTFVLSTFLDSPTILNFTRKFKIVQSPYWEWHYVFGKVTQKKVPVLGKSSIDSIVINTAVPLLIAYGKQKEDKEYQQKGLHWLEHLKGEKNTITKLLEEDGFTMKTAYDSQGGISLYKNYCLPKKCLECPIGEKIIK